MVEQLRARQALWFAQRAAEQEKQSVRQELQRGGFVCTTSADSEPAINIRSEDVLDQLTQRITVRLRSELQAELQKTAIKTETGHQHARQQIEGSLYQEMESHTCPICYELMAPPRNAPILLFPCGHTFCHVCIKAHTQQHKKRLCPCCREPIQSQAPNVSLQQLIASFAAQSKQLGLQPLQPQSSAAQNGHTPGFNQSSAVLAVQETDDLSATRLQSQMTMLTMRCRVLQNELIEGQQEQQTVKASIASLQQALQLQMAEKDRCAKRLLEAQAIADHAAAQAGSTADKLEALQKARHEQQARSDLIQRTLVPLQQEIDKVGMLLLGVQGSMSAGTGHC